METKVWNILCQYHLQQTLPKKRFATATEIQLKGIMCLPVHRPLEFQNRRPQVRLLWLLVHPYVISINE